MKAVDTQPIDEKAAACRRLAEKRLADSGKELSSQTKGADTARIMHELLVHQVELELQNEELIEARAELEANTERFTELYDFAPVGYFSISANGLIRQLNFLAARMLGRERALLLESRFEDFVSRGSQQPFKRFLSMVFMGEAAQPCEVQIMGQGESIFVLRLTGVLSPNGLLCRMAAMDVTDQRKAELAVKEKNEDLNRIFNMSPDLIGIANFSGRFVRINPAFQRMLGYSLDELTSRDFADFVHPDDRDRTAGAISELKYGRDITDFVNRYRCLDGSYRWLEWRATPFRGNLICALGRDISERKQAENALRVSEEKFRSIVESSPMAMFFYEFAADGRFILTGANPAAEMEIGIERESLYGKTAEEAFPKLVGTDIPEMYRNIAMGNLGTQSFTIHYDDEQICGYFDVRAFQTSPGTLVVAFMDISERVKAEEELKKTQDELELRVQRRTSQLQERTLQLRALASELTQAEERERRRIAGLIHDDLQQTLVAASLSVRMLKAKIPDQEIATELGEITEMLGDSITISRSLTAELSPPVLQQFGLAAAFKWLRAWCMEKYGLEVDLHADEDLDTGLEVGVILFRAVRELLFNIVKHSSVKSACLRMTRTHDGGAKIEVSDHGAGFDPIEIRAREGSAGGFGLFNIRERLELLGGWFEIESSPGLGSRFTMWVPLAANPDVKPAVPPGELAGLPLVIESIHAEHHGNSQPQCAKKSGKIRIVLADDHAAVRESLVRLFQAEPDLEVVAQATDGEQALQLARLLHPDFVVMDINMPRMDGIEATAAIRKSIPCVQVLGLSTYADDEHREAMIRAGAVDLLHKNNPTSDIVAILRSYAATAACPYHPGE